jgi:hypothetical protein
VRPGKGEILGNLELTLVQQVYPSHPLFCSCHWPDILKPWYITNTFLICITLAFTSTNSFTLKMEAVCSSEMSTFKHVTATKGKLMLDQQPQ